MAEISNKKRKRQGEAGVKPKKKVAMDAPPPAVTVSSVLRPKFCPPVIGTSIANWRAMRLLTNYSFVPRLRCSEKYAVPLIFTEGRAISQGEATETCDT